MGLIRGKTGKCQILLLILLVHIIAAVAAAAAVTHHLNWEQYKAQHGKYYADPEEENVRQQTFHNSSATINQHNSEYQQGLHSYQQETNKFSDMTPQEKKAYSGTSYIHPSIIPSGLQVKFNTSITIRPIPALKDWRESGAVSSIKNQGNCGSCYAFSSVAALEGHSFLKSGKMIELSEQQIIDCSQSFGNHGCNGGHPYNVYNYVSSITANNNFVQARNCYPYSSDTTLKPGTCQTMNSQNCEGSQITGQNHVQGEADLLTAVANIGPVVVLIDASPNSFKHYKSGVYDDPACNSTHYDHGVLCVGFGNENGKDYWLIKNSWGTNWGEQGYVKLARGKSRCAIGVLSAYPTV